MYIRLSIARPRPGQEQELREVQAEIVRWTRTQPGCEQSYLLHPHDQSGEVARIGIYESEDIADAIAQTPHLMSLRSKLNHLATPDGEERGFHVESDDPAAL